MLFFMSKRQMRKKLQGSHVNDYAHFSKAENTIKLPDFEKEDGKYDYFKAEFNFLVGIYVESKNPNSSIKSLRYYKNDKSYSIVLRDCDKQTFKSSIENFFDLACIGLIERGELKSIKRLIEPILKRLENL